MGNSSVHLRTDDTFIAALKAKNAEAWEEFINGYGVKIYHYLQYNVPTAESVEDIWNETIIAVAQVIDDFDQKVRLSTLVYSIAYRKVADYWRRQKDTFELKDIGLVDKPFAELMSQLPEQAQQVLVLRYYVGLSVAEIAEILGRSLKGTESLLSRARQQLHKNHQHELALTRSVESVDEATKSQTKVLFGAAHPMLLVQKQLCQQNGMSAEAAIFERAQHQMEQLAAIPANDFLAELQKIEALFSLKESSLFIELLSKMLSNT